MTVGILIGGCGKVPRKGGNSRMMGGGWIHQKRKENGDEGIP